MTDSLIAAIQSFTLNARKLLERESEEQLQGLYGWLPDGSFAAGTALGLPEAAETRARLEAYVAEEADAGVSAPAAREKLKRETAFTWLNRAVAFRLMEERGIIKSTFAKLHKANAFIYYLTEVLGEGSIPASTPINAMGEGPVDAAYRKFLLWQCGELARDVSVLFDPTTLASSFCPRPAVLKELADAMNAADIADAWKPGNEESIGWVYQGFSSQELQDAFAAARESKTKFEPKDIPAVTQLFTIRWVVRFLVENTLGRIWVEMHPGSRLATSLEYLVPLKEPKTRPPKLAKEITFLDPCCGSMHFGLLAFDLFAEMYREEIENAGKPGWPAKASAASEEEIPALILAHNIHGIDIDSRAVQLSALTLLLRARTLNKLAVVTDRNLASANIEQITGGRLEEFIQQTKFSHPIYERILRRLALRLKDSENLGSLLRIEKEIKQLVEAERSQAGGLLKDLPGLHPEQFGTPEGAEEFFDLLTEQIGQHLDHFVQSSRSEGKNSGMFAAEAAKGLRFLRLVEQRYDVVVTNPPYLSGRKMNKRLSTLMDEEFKEGKGDLYAAFILRCQEFLAADGLMGMLTMHSFMFISSYEDLRAKLRKEVAITTFAHFGGGLFAVGNPGTLQTAAFVLRREPDASRREEQVGTYFRLVKERNADSKQQAFESALAALRKGESHHQSYNYKQADFDAIPGKPWVYWITAKIRLVFKEHPSITEIAKPKHGMATANNFRFLRKWYEVGKNRIGFDYLAKQAAECGKDWFPYMKGGPVISWYGNMDHVVNYGEDGYELKAWADPLYGNSGWSRSLVSAGFYFRRGVTWSLISSTGFAGRLSPGGFVFDVAGMTCFPPETLLRTFLAVLNCRLARFLLSAINPTINFQVGDIERLPIPSERSPKIDALVDQCVELKRQTSCESEATYEFIQPLLGIDKHTVRRSQLAILEVEIDAEVSRLYGLSEEDLAAIDRELTGISPAGEEDASASDADDTKGDDDEAAVTSDLTSAAWARSWLSYAIGTVLGRFEIGEPGGLGCGEFPEATVTAIRALIAPDSIMPCNAGHPQDLAARAVACLEHMLGAAQARDAIRTATGSEDDAVESVRGWLDRFTGTPEKSFWKFHHQLYRKRPVYWPFQSPKKTFTVWVFHEKIGANTLHTLKQLADEHLNLIERRITDLRPTAATNRAAEKELQKLLEEGDDVREFSARLKAHIDADYESCLDDGVLLNAAPLHDLLPSWPETRAAWKELEAEKYEWAHQAMRHWPARVTEACRTNRSFAIAHNLEHLCPADPPKAGKKPGRTKNAAPGLI
jgi:hypothetical protein